MTGLELLFLFVIAWILMYLRPAPVVWTLVMGLALTLASIYCGFSSALVIVLWVVFLAVAAMANLPFLRITLFSRPFLNRFRKILPPMSTTEREALDAGDVWWEGDLFAGRPNWSKLHAIPKPSLTADERSFINTETNELCALLDDWQIMFEEHDMTQQTWDFLKQKGFFGLVIDKKYGGKGFSAMAHSTIVSKIASRSMSAAITAMVPNSLGPGELLAHYGTEEQKDYYLPRLAKGEEVPCFALTSTAGGSDAGAMRDAGVVCKGQHDGKEVLGIRLSWDKRYITLAPVATVLGLAFKLYDPEHLLGEKENIGITVCLLPTTHPGVEVGERHFPMGLAFMNGPTRGKDVFIPLEWVIGGPSMVGKGWRMLMECLSIGRSISLPALGAAVGRVSYYSNGIYAALRKQFKVPLGQFEGVQEALAKIAGNTYMLEASRRMTAGAVDLHVKPSVVSAIQKYHATELARVMSDASMDIHAGRAVQLGPRNYVGQLQISLPIAITVEGANILTRNLIIFGQGAIRCHPYVLQEMQAAAEKDPRGAVKKFDRLLASHIGFTVSNVVRALTFALTSARFIKAPKRGGMARYYRQLTRMSTALALCSDFAMLVLGGSLKRKERLSARLGDILSQLYLASTVLKYYADEQYPSEDKASVKWCLQTALYQAQNAAFEFLANFPNRLIARLLRFIVFPLGRVYQRPSDALETQLATTMMQTNELRDRMTTDVYVPADKTDCLGRMAHAYKLAQECEKLEALIKQAVREQKLVFDADELKLARAAHAANIISETQLQQLEEKIAVVHDAMEVDAFAADFFKKNVN